MAEAKAPTGNKLSFVLYEAKQAPRYYEIRKSLFRFLIWGLPVVSFISLITVLGVLYYFQTIRTMVETKEPFIIRQLREEKLALEDKNKELSGLIKGLEGKLALGVKGDEGMGTLSLFKQTPGAQDQTKSPVLQIEEAQHRVAQDTLDFWFNLVNISKDGQKVSGFIFVIAKMGDAIHVWPKNPFPQNELQIAFNNGEIFATSRFRPVETSFPKPVFEKGQNSMDVLFKVLVFSRTGDLMHKQIFSKNIQY